ncbi:MAG TPA: hypothetical protein VGQ65_16195 [Thermoanaerobaculia bacterium]|jgi:hypothetical protein|nr:hypothetical protein [Thermoanaerobaculia bacterium]
MPKITLTEALKAVPFVAAVVGAFLLRDTPLPIINGLLIVIVVAAAIMNLIIGAQAVRLWRRFGLHDDASNSDDGGKALTMLVVHDSTADPVVEEIKSRNGPRVAIATITEDTILPMAMNTADAIYFVWTKAMADRPGLLKALDDWAWNHLHVPVLIVDAAGLDKDRLGPFTVVEADHASPTRMLRQVTARTKMWIGLSKRMHSWWVYTSAVCLVALAMFGYFTVRYRYTKEHLDRRDDLIEPKLTMLASRLMDWRQREELGVAPIPVNSDLTQAAAFVLNDIARQTDIKSAPDDHISVFRKVNDNLKQVDESLNEPAKLTVRGSIAGCSLRNSAFILWEQNCTVGATSAWDKFGNPIGKNQQDCTIQLDVAHHGDVCTYEVQDPNGPLHNSGMLCYSQEIQGSVTRSDTVVCLVTPKETAFLRSRTAKAKLQMFGVIANSIPTNALIPKAPVGPSHSDHGNN